jgi:hypothetical protein
MINIFTLLKISIRKIKDEILLFAVFTILLSVSFSEHRVSIFLFFCTATSFYLVKTLIQSKQQTKDNKHFENFAKFLKIRSYWEKRMIDNWPVYFYSLDNNYKIEQSQDSHKTWTATEPWMDIFPDQRVSEYKVYLKYSDSKIKELIFVSCDGGRYFIPLPNKRLFEERINKDNAKFEYYWVKSSVEYLVGEVIGEFYRQNNMQEVAKICKIKIL